MLLKSDNDLFILNSFNFNEIALNGIFWKK